MLAFHGGNNRFPRPPDRSATRRRADPRPRRTVASWWSTTSRWWRAPIVQFLAGEHEVEIAVSGEEAAARLEAGERWDLVLCDLLMPGMTGMDLAARLARSAPDVVPRLVFITGGAFTDRSRAFLGRGEHRHLEKPIDAAVLRRVVQEVASGH